MSCYATTRDNVLHTILLLPEIKFSRILIISLYNIPDKRLQEERIELFSGEVKEELVK